MKYEMLINEVMKLITQYSLIQKKINLYIYIYF